MKNVKTGFDVEVMIMTDHLPREATPSLNEKIVAAALKRNPKRVAVDVDTDGNIIIDKDKHPELYDWAVNG